MDVTHIVIPLHKNGGKLKDNSELRFTLRALERHFKGAYDVTIIGEVVPKWASDIRHVVAKGGLKTALKKAAATYPEGFFWWYDDVVLLRDVEAKDLQVAFASRKWAGAQTGWAAGLQKIRERLEEEGYKAWDYSRPHGPYWFDQGMVDEGFKDWPGMAGKFPWESWILSKRDWPRRHGGFKQCYGKFKRSPKKGCWYINFNDSGFSTDLRNWLYARFPEKSRFERKGSFWNQGAKEGTKKVSVVIEGNRVIKTRLEEIDDRHSIEKEAEIIRSLNIAGCPCVPRLLDSGINGSGQPYLVLEKLEGSVQDVRPEDVWLSYQAVRASGWEHGDLMEHNVIFDGRVAWLIDFDRAFPAEAEAAWGKGWIDAGLSAKFEGFRSGVFDLSSVSLARTDRGRLRHIYHPIDVQGFHLKGERGIWGRLEVLDKIDFTGEAVLDVGCNTGAASRHIAMSAAVVDGFEFNSKDALLGQFVNCLSGVRNCQIYPGKIGEGTQVHGRYDTVLLFSVLHHFLNPVAASLELAGRCRRVLVEAKLKEEGHYYGGVGNSQKTTKWSFTRWEDLHAHVEALFPGFRFTMDHGAGDRKRRLMEFRKFK